MDIYRSPMEKILRQCEDDTIITNPRDPGRTLLRKIVFRYTAWVDRVKRLLKRTQGGER